MIYEPRPISTIVKHDTIFMQYNNVISMVAARGKISGKNFHKNPISDTAIRDIVTSTLCFVYTQIPSSFYPLQNIFCLIM